MTWFCAKVPLIEVLSKTETHENRKPLGDEDPKDFSIYKPNLSATKSASLSPRPDKLTKMV